MVAHYRHTHTDYEDRLRESSDQRFERYLDLREEGYGYDEAWMQVDSEEDETSVKGRIKADCNAEAIKLLHQDFPSIFTMNPDPNTKQDQLADYRVSLSKSDARPLVGAVEH